jgi:hypothetical protein
MEANSGERPKQSVMHGRFEMRIDAELQALVDNWRAMQPRIPSMADAIRHLVRLGLHQPAAPKASIRWFVENDGLHRLEVFDTVLQRWAPVPVVSPSSANLRLNKPE